MSDNNLARYGGIAGILALIVAFSVAVLPSFTDALLLVALVLLAVMTFSLYRIYRSQEPTLSLIGLVVGIGAPVVLLVSMLISSKPGNFSGLVMGASFFAMTFCFGLAAYRQKSQDVPRLLAILGIVAGVAGLVNFVLVLVGGGDYANPNNPALSPLIMGSYLLAALLALIWIVWTGVNLIRGKMVTAS